ncbi:hypothetical protein CLAC_03270 [Corynebacterium lactis RW2-5]|uniref:HTH cro/C1-type domain-containing protein n=2 Tax=Corynebacterium lactis TaxID=1231000 RepID=A0A0K2H3Y2_9CORY|nr:hypothetical protein CLAC_03270 [Corynebacterium lactis RW2-5]
MGDDNNTEAAKKSGISSSNFTRWKKGARADPDFVVKVARAYDVNVLEALVEAEFITEEEAALTTVAPTLDLSQVDAQELIDELQHRVDIIKQLLSLEEGGDRKLAAIIEHRSNVVNFQSARPATHDGTVTDWDNSIPHAAKNGTDENEERIKRNEDPID